MATSNDLNISQAGVVSFDGTAVFTGSPLTQHDVLVGGASNAITNVSPSTAGFVLTSNGISADPSFQDVSASGALKTLTGDSGGAVSPTAGNINILGGTTGLTFSGTSSTLTLNSPELNLPDTTTSAIGLININGNRFLHKYGDANNVFVGTNAGNFTNTTALANTAVGSGALNSLTTGDNHVAIGNLALNAVTTSNSCIAIGQGAMKLAQTNVSTTIAIGNNAFSSFVSGSGGSNIYIGSSCALNTTAGANNTIIGSGALSVGASTGGSNTGLGTNSLQSMTTAGFNTAIGAGGLIALLTGSRNCVIGYNAGNALTSSESDNIYMNTPGVIGDNNTLRIGASTGTGSQGLTKAYIHGINGNTVSNPLFVTINSSTSQLGVTSSSSFIYNWTSVTSSTQTLAVGNGYVTNNAGGVTYTLPSTASLGDTIKIVGKLGLAVITPNASQQIIVGSTVGLVGVTGTVTSNNAGDCIELICITAGSSTVWTADSVVGTWTIVTS